MSPMVGACRARPASGTRFDTAVNAKQLNSLSLFTVKARSIKVDIAPPHRYFCLNIPLGRPFSVIDSNRRYRFTDDAHLFQPDQHFHLEAASECRLLAACLNSEQVTDYAFKLSGSRKLFEAGVKTRMSLSTPERVVLIRELARLWSDLQRGDAALASIISTAEREDALMANFILATQGAEATDHRSGEHADSAVIARAEEYLRACLTRPASRAELAAETGTSIRTLSRSFTKRWGTGPIGFLKAQRMDAAYRELLGAERDATTVTEVAFRYGFAHLGKFAGEYKRAFHESPSETLRH